MTSEHAQDAFEIRFESAVTDMHQHTTRGNQPSASVWEAIHAGVRETRADAADLRAPGPDPAPVSRKTRRMRKESAMDMTLNPGMAAPPSRSHRGLFTWAAVALVGMLVISSLLWYGQIPPGDDQNDLAWAPGLGTPGSTPETALSCDVEPLTLEEVMDTVLNPSNGYVRLGLTEFEENQGELFESPSYDINKETDKTGYTRSEDLAVLEDAVSTANMYSNCVQSGTLYQVWALMEPTIVQKDVLNRFPVLRTEEQLRSFVAKWGPQKFPGDGRGIIGRFPGYAKSSGASDLLGSSMINGRQNDLAIVALHHDHKLVVEVSLQLFPNGQWLVTGLHSPNSRG